MTLNAEYVCPAKVSAPDAVLGMAEVRILRLLIVGLVLVRFVQIVGFYIARA